MVGTDWCSNGNARCLRWCQSVGAGGVQAGLRLMLMGIDNGAGDTSGRWTCAVSCFQFCVNQVGLPAEPLPVISAKVFLQDVIEGMSPHHIPSSSIVSDVFAVLAEKSEPLKARTMRQQLPDRLALAVSPLSAARLRLTSLLTVSRLCDLLFFRELCELLVDLP